MNGYEINKLTMDDLEEVLAIERELEFYPWSPTAFKYELASNPNAYYLALRQEGKVAGYAGVWLLESDAHISTITIEKSKRRRGMGAILLWHLLEECRRRRCHWVTLEVWNGNLPAISLYKQFGFITGGYRRDYYDNGEDALIMWAGSLQNRYFQEKIREIKKKYQNRAKIWFSGKNY